MSFIPRTAFTYPNRTPSWYAGHMARSMREMGVLLNDIDLVIEARDARLPLTSINGVFDGLLEKVWGSRTTMFAEGSGTASARAEEWKIDRKGKMREKMVVYTKRDLAEERYEKPLIKAFKHLFGQKVVFADTRVDADIKDILHHAVRLAKKQQVMDQMNILVVGMPNVGKSSLLNALRRVGVHKAKHFKVGAMAGVTRKIGGTVKIHTDPNVYVYDTPGVMVPFLGHGDTGAERGLKYALTGGIKEDLFELEAIIDYLLWRINQRLVLEQDLPQSSRSASYANSLPLPPDFQPTDHLYTLLDALCQRIGALRKGGERDYDAAMTFIHHAFRDGKLGRWTFDRLDEGIKSGDTKAALDSTPSAPFSPALTTAPSFLLPQAPSEPPTPSSTAAAHSVSETESSISPSSSSPSPESSSASPASSPPASSIPPIRTASSSDPSPPQPPSLPSSQSSTSSPAVTQLTPPFSEIQTPGAESSPVATKPMSLDEQVLLAVQGYIQMLTIQKIDIEEGKGLSVSAQRKKEKQEKKEKREESWKARMEAKGYNPDSLKSKVRKSGKDRTGGKSGFARGAGGKRR